MSSSRVIGAIVIALSLAALATASVRFTPSLGNLGRDNAHTHELIPVYLQDFEGDLSSLAPLGAGGAPTNDPAEVLGGSQSIKLTQPASGFVLMPDELALAPLETYVIEYRYRSLAVGPSNLPVVVVAQWTGQETFDRILGGPIAGVFPEVGKQRLSIRVANVLDARLVFATLDSDVVIDDIRIFRYAISAESPRIALPKASFPRLGNYNLDRTMATALRTGLTVDEVEATLALYDLVTGIEPDHTFGFDNGAASLRDANPDILLFPYFQTFIAQRPTELSFGGSAWLRGLFNDGLELEWFMRGPDGSLLNEPLYPFNFQMNHTNRGELVDGVAYRDYVRHFLTQTLLPSGLWQGVHFDQAEWHPNPLLREGDPFLGELGPLPPIDLDGDGVAEPEPELFRVWRASFDAYFAELDVTLGASAMLFGNAGFIPGAPDVLARLNGWQAEFVLPYAIDENGDYITSEGGKVLDLMTRYEQASRLTRAPHVINLQFTGHGLGTLTGGITANGLPDREPVLEMRDYRRARFGLALTLMNDGYFGYDYVDNTTAPVWIDEYAVDADGFPVRAAAGKGYLGQPLDDAAEITAAGVEVLDIGFEEAPPASVTFGPSFRLTTDPDEVIAGVQSIVFLHSEPDHSPMMFETVAEQLPLEPGTTYELSLDYEVLSYAPADHETFFYAGFTDPVNGLRPARLSALFDVDVSGAGQSGRLRTIVKMDATDARVVAAFGDAGSVVVDNIRLTETHGSVFRRDFENGVVIVNPSPNPRSLTQAEVAGALGRTGVRRLHGLQDPFWNDGSFVVGGLELASGDAIILLADPIATTAPSSPEGVGVVSSSETSLTLSWAASTGAVAGYLVRYGELGGDRTRTVVASRSASATVNGLEPGRIYELAVAAYDHRGQQTSFAQPVLAATAGVAPERPILARSEVTLVPGTIVTMATAGASAPAFAADGPPYPLSAAGTELWVNGMAAPILSTDSNHVSFIVPWNVGGGNAVVRLERNGVGSPELLVPVAAVDPFVWSWDGTAVIAVHASTLEIVGPLAPATSGDTILIVASGLGTIEPPPAPGTLPLEALPSRTRFQPTVRVGDDIVDGEASIFFGMLGVYGVEFRIPDTLAPGEHAVSISIAGQASNDATLFTQ